MLLIVDKDLEPEVMTKNIKDVSIVKFYEDYYTSYFVIVPNECVIQEEGLSPSYSMECTVNKFKESLDNEVYLLDLIGVFSPIATAVVATPLPFRHPFLFEVFQYVEPYAMSLSIKPEHSSIVSQLLTWFIIISTKCSDLLLDQHASVIAYNKYVTVSLPQNLADLFKHCFEAFESKVMISRDATLILRQRDKEAYKKYLEKLIENLSKILP